MTLFDRDKFVSHCCSPCGKSRRLLLDKIEQYRQSEPEMVWYLEQCRDRLWEDQMKFDRFHQLRREKGDRTLNEETCAALRAMADKLEAPGPHFMVYCDIPKFDGDYGCHIEVSLVGGPLGG